MSRAYDESLSRDAAAAAGRWAEVSDDGAVFHAAHHVWLCRESDALLLQFWMADEVNTPRTAYWHFVVWHRNGVRRQVWTCGWQGPSDMTPVLLSAEGVLRRIDEETGQEPTPRPWE